MYTLACSSGLILQKDMAIIYYYCDILLSLKLSIFSLIIMYFGTLISHHFDSKVSGGSMPSGPLYYERELIIAGLPTCLECNSLSG